MKKILANMLVFLFISAPVLAGDITANGMYQKDLHTFLSNTVTLTSELTADHATSKLSNDPMRNLMLNRLMTDGGVAVGGTTQNVQLVNTINYTINGEFKSKGATDDLWTLEGSAVTTPNYNKYVLMLDGSGTATVNAGTQASAAASVTLPALESSYCVVGVVTVRAVTANFTPGTTSLGSADIDVTYFDGFDPLYIPAGPASLRTSDLTLDNL